MKYKDYSPDIWQRFHTALEQILEVDSEPVAAFDADGTLWDIDLGETLFHHQIDKKLVSLPPSPWEFYQETKAADPRKAYLWLAQICQGHSLEQVRQWADEAVKTAAPVPVFSEQKKIIDLLIAKGVKVYIITASVKWAVEPGAALLGLPQESVIGVETLVENGIVTDKQKGIITYREGKVEALLAKTGGKKPFFASGNTMGDFQLLQTATHMSLAVSAANQDDRLYKTELELIEQAKHRGWPSHRFI